MTTDYLTKVANHFIELGNMLNEISKELESKETIQENKEELLSRGKVLERYPIFNESSLYRATKFKGLSSYQLGKHTYYKSADIDAWIESQKVKSAVPNVGF